MTRCYDPDGNPINTTQWSIMMRDHQRVASNIVNHDPLHEGGSVTVSTVWLGLDHQYGDGPPLIFETMIFGGEHDGYQERYSTKEQALAGHAKAVKMVE